MIFMHIKTALGTLAIAALLGWFGPLLDAKEQPTKHTGPCEENGAQRVVDGITICLTHRGFKTGRKVSQ